MNQKTREEIVAGPQVLPIKGEETVRRAIEELLTKPNLYDKKKVYEDCLIKLEAGEAKYGAPLESFNGRSADLDAYQDIIDSINYQVQGLLEATTLDESIARTSVMQSTVSIACNIRRFLVEAEVLE